MRADSTASSSAPLSDDDLDRLADLLAATPAPLQPLDCIALDGYLCGVLAQPQLLQPEQWLPGVFDIDGQPLPHDFDAAWQAQTRHLVERHAQALRHALAEDGGFDPVLPAVALEAPEEDPQLPEASRLLWPWVAGFALAMERFPALANLDDDAVVDPLERLYRHLPTETDEERALRAELDTALPLASADDAIDDLVAAVVQLVDHTEPLRYHVEQRRHDSPKVGRNDPCPCGSGKKFKACHGAA